MAINSDQEHVIFRQARCIVLLFGIATGVLMFWWASEAHGIAAGAVCASLWLFDPSCLAFSGVCTGDIGSAFFGLLATFAYWKHLRHPSRARLIMAGILLGLAAGSKFNMMMIYPAWFVFALVVSKRDLSGHPQCDRIRVLSEVACMGLIGLLTLNGLYRFEGTLTQLETFEFRSRVLSGAAETSLREPHEGNRFRGTIFAGMPVPLPRQYVLGLDSQRWEAEVGLEDMQNGQMTRSYRWYAPLVSLGTKLPVGTLVLLAFGVTSGFLRRNVTCSLSLLLSLTGGLLLATICSQVGLNWPIRYSLSAFSFFVIALSGAFAALVKHRFGRLLIVLCVISNFVEVVKIRPYYYLTQIS